MHSTCELPSGRMIGPGSHQVQQHECPGQCIHTCLKQVQVSMNANVRLGCDAALPEFSAQVPAHALTSGECQVQDCMHHSPPADAPTH